MNNTVRQITATISEIHVTSTFTTVRVGVEPVFARRTYIPPDRGDG